MTLEEKIKAGGPACQVAMAKEYLRDAKGCKATAVMNALDAHVRLDRSAWEAADKQMRG